VAAKLEAPLDVVVVLNLCVPGWENLAVGAIASGGVRTLDEAVMDRKRVTPEEVRLATLSGMRELQRREVRYRGRAGAPDVEGKTVILVDDGIVTGMTLRSAVRALRPQDPAGVIIAVPAASREGCLLLRPLVDDLVALTIPDEFHSLGRWYESFEIIGDEEVARLLSEACEHTRSFPVD
jgi:predicted phosphoribosyltransferase